MVGAQEQSKHQPEQIRVYGINVVTEEDDRMPDQVHAGLSYPGGAGGQLRWFS